MLVSPSILSADLYHLGAELDKVKDADWLHIDAMDGHFVPNLTFGANMVKAIRPHTEQYLDCHLMIEQPERYIEDYAQAGADLITVHAEASPHSHRLIQQIKNLGVDAGLAINPGTSVDSIKALLPFVDCVLVMTVNPGFGGQNFIKEMVDKVYLLDDLRQIGQHDYKIQVDGGINLETGRQCAEAGADCLVSGSYLFSQDDISQTIQDMKNL